jgi:hypothetical protein
MSVRQRYYIAGTPFSFMNRSLQIITNRDEYSPSATTDCQVDIPHMSVASSTPSARALRLRRRNLLREEQATDRSSGQKSKTATATKSDYKGVFSELKIGHEEPTLVHNVDIKSPATSVLQPETHHRPMISASVVRRTQNSRVPSPLGDGFVPDTQYNVRQRHRSRSSNRSNFQRNKTPKINFPPAGDKAAWRILDKDLGKILPTVFSKKVTEETPIAELTEKLDAFLVEFFVERCIPTDPPSEKKTKFHTSKRKFRHRGLEALRKAKKRCRSARRVLWKNGMKGSDDDRLLAFRLRELVKAHNKLSRRVKAKAKTKEHIATSRRFRKDPYLFATKLFKDQKKSKSPTFSKDTAEKYFCETYRDEKRDHQFVPPPSWKRPALPKHCFEMRCPTLKQLKKAVRHKRNGAAAGLNGLTYVPYKRCDSIMRLVHQIMKRIWKSQNVPDDWAAAYIILLSKSDVLDDPSEFRPIAITATVGKIFFSVISDRLQKFMVKNNYILSTVQKGFLFGVPGCIEHAFALFEALRDAKKAGRQIIVSWIDLKNAYGSVRHNLIQFALDWYHVPKEIQKLIFVYYEKVKAKVVTSDWTTDFFLFDIGLFQGCVLSSILFDCVFQLLLDVLKSYDHLGYNFKNCSISTLAKAYADDLSLITRNSSSNQKVLDASVEWLDWTVTMAAKPKKCVSLGLKRFHRNEKTGFTRHQESWFSAFDPRLEIKGKAVGFIVNPNKDDDFLKEHFKFIGRWIRFDLSEHSVKSRIKKHFVDDMKRVEESNVKGFEKLWLYQFGVLARMGWPFLIHDLDVSFAKDLEKSVSCQLKRWAGLVKNADVGTLFRTRSSFGLGLSSVSKHYEQMQLIKFSILDHSQDPFINTIFANKVLNDKDCKRTKKTIRLYTALNAEVKLDSLFPTQSDRQGLGAGNFVANPSNKDLRRNVLAKFKGVVDNNHLIHAMTLQMQGTWVKWHEKTIPFDLSWRNLIYGCNEYILRFVLNATINSVVTPDLLRLWGKIENDTCPLCTKGQCTQMHILSSCPYSLYHHRYNWRHDSVLKNIELELVPHILLHNSRPIAKEKKESIVTPIHKNFISQTEVHRQIYGRKKSVRIAKTSMLNGANDWKVLIDYDNNPIVFPVDILATNARPDIVIYSRSKKVVFLIELTCPSEENFDDARLRKENRYATLLDAITPTKTGWTARLFTLEIGARGFVSKFVKSWLRKFGFSSRAATVLCKDLSIIAAKCSYAIYRARTSKLWEPNRPLLICPRLEPRFSAHKLTEPTDIQYRPLRHQTPPVADKIVCPTPSSTSYKPEAGSLNHLPNALAKMSANGIDKVDSTWVKVALELEQQLKKVDESKSSTANIEMKYLPTSTTNTANKLGTSYEDAWIDDALAVEYDLELEQFENDLQIERDLEEMEFYHS